MWDDWEKHGYKTGWSEQFKLKNLFSQLKAEWHKYIQDAYAMLNIEELSSL